jgi:hypothetical protein
VTATTPGMRLPPGGQPRLTAGGWRVDPAQSHASFAASVVGRPVRGRLPRSGEVLITEPIEDSTARLAARAGAVSTGSPVLDRLLAGPGRMAGRRPTAGQEQTGSPRPAGQVTCQAVQGFFVATPQPHGAHRIPGPAAPVGNPYGY